MRQVDALVAATLQTFHGVDILVNNAGIVRAADFLDMTEADFDEVIRVNLKGMFLVGAKSSSMLLVMRVSKQAHNTSESAPCPGWVLGGWLLTWVANTAVMHAQCGQAVGRQMREQNRVREGRGGAIINMSSVNGITAIPSIAGYNSSKGGVDNLTRCWLYRP